MLFCITYISGCIDISQPVNVNDTKPVYRVGVDVEYAPICYVDIDGSWVGFDVESIQWIGKEMGFEVVMVPFIWTNWLALLEYNRIDMIYKGMTITPERAELINFSNPYLVVDQAVASHIDSNYTMENFFEGKGKIGVRQGATGEEWVVNNLVKDGVFSSSQIVQYDGLTLAFRHLSEKKIDFIVHDMPPMRHGIANLPQLTIIGAIETHEEYGIGLRKDDVELLQTLNEGLSRLMASPKWTELLEKYQLTAYTSTLN